MKDHRLSPLYDHRITEDAECKCEPDRTSTKRGAEHGQPCRQQARYCTRYSIILYYTVASLLHDNLGLKTSVSALMTDFYSDGTSYNGSARMKQCCK